MVLFDDLVAEVLVEVPGVSDPLAVREIRRATIAFCEETKALKMYGPVVTLVANEPRYDISVPDGYTLVDLRSVSIDGKPPISQTSEDALDLQHSDTGIRWREELGDTPKAYFIEKEDDALPQMRLVYIPTVGGLTLRYRMALTPHRTATGVDDFIADKYFKAIADGAIASLLKIPKKPWTDLTSAAIYQSWFQDAIGRAAGDGARDYVRDDETVIRTTAYK